MSDEKTWTVIGFWYEDEPVSTGVVEGNVTVYGGSDELNDGDDLVPGSKGLWAMPAVADTPLRAENVAIMKMRATLDDDEEEGGDEGEHPRRFSDYDEEDDDRTFEPELDTDGNPVPKPNLY